MHRSPYAKTDRDRRLTFQSVERESKLHDARHQLFLQGVRRGYITVEEIDAALPPDVLTSAERWLLYYCLDATGIEVRRVGLAIAPPSRTASQRM